MSNIGDRMIFSGGPEHSPLVEITHETNHPSTRRGNGHSRRMILIEQDGNEVEISLMTLENIVNWAK